ncbi:hypothetical protein NQ318_017945 [Aromia moschata]|uniref:Sorting nexin n=1 Tax=Aromia moschata TaxID=1265417 RepID=A0AAV8Y409_9CUCU|nr:hypothetical protein NQ318_017945 [Aromia moschata]
MATFKARVLYDFQGESGTAEMTISAGEVLTVTRTDVGEGWWEGLNSKGQSGLFPEAYVEKISASSPPNIPAPMLPPQAGDWGDSQTHQDDDWDDDWDDDTYSEIANNQTPTQSIYSNEANHNQNQFSYGGQCCGFLGTGKDLPTANKKIHIFRDSDDVLGRWEAISNPYTVQIASPKKASKMGGLKSFIAYQLTPSFSNVEVSRRYKHFDWLHSRLTTKFNIVAIPPLPDKQVSGRYEEHFIEHRRAQLQEFINYMCRHPVLSTCDVWVHFLTCTDEKQWKQGKRNAERDQLVGANFCMCVKRQRRKFYHVKSIGSTYIMIGKLYEEQAKLDWQPLFDKLYIYKGITNCLPDILNLQKLSEQKKRECERNSMQQVALADVRRRADVLTYTVFAEMEHFQNERDTDLKLTLKNFLQEQLNFYKNVVCKLEDTLKQFD